MDLLVAQRWVRKGFHGIDVREPLTLNLSEVQVLGLLMASRGEFRDMEYC